MAQRIENPMKAREQEFQDILNKIKRKDNNNPGGEDNNRRMESDKGERQKKNRKIQWSEETKEVEGQKRLGNGL